LFETYGKLLLDAKRPRLARTYLEAAIRVAERMDGPRLPTLGEGKKVLKPAALLRFAVPKEGLLAFWKPIEFRPMEPLDLPWKDKDWLKAHRKKLVLRLEDLR
jgi:hypothetical protein